MSEETIPKKRPRSKKAATKSGSGPHKESEAFDLTKTHTIEGFKALCEKVRASIEARRDEKIKVLEAAALLKAERDALRSRVEKEGEEASASLKARLLRLKERQQAVEEELAAIAKQKELDERKRVADEPSGKGKGKAKSKKKTSSHKSGREIELIDERKKLAVDVSSVENEMRNASYGKRHGFHSEVVLNERIKKIERYAKSIDDTARRYIEVLDAYETHADLLCHKQRDATDRILAERRNILHWEKKRGASNARGLRSEEELRAEEELVAKQEEELRRALKMLAREMLSSLGANVSVTRYVRSDFCPKCRSERLRMLSTGGAMECLRCGHWQKHVDAASQTGGSFFFASTGNFGGAASTSCGADSSSVGGTRKDEEGYSGLSASRRKACGRIIERVFELCNMEPRLSQESYDKAVAIVRKAHPSRDDLTYREVASALKAAKQETLYRHAVQIACRMFNKRVPRLTESEIDTLATVCEVLQEHREFLKEKKERNNVVWSTLVNIQQLYIVGRPDLICFLDPIKTPAKIASVEEELKVCYEKAFGTKYHPARDIVSAVDCPRPPKGSTLLDYGEPLVWNETTTKRVATGARKESPAKKARKYEEEEEEEDDDDDDEFCESE